MPPVVHLAATVLRLRGAWAVFRNEVLAGPGGRPMLPAGPSGNLVELFEGR